MSEVFEMIINYPLQFIAGLGLSSGTIYAIISLIKGLISLITKNSKKLKQVAERNAIADTVLTKLGGVEGFIDNVANTVINKLTESSGFNELKKLLAEVKNRETCPAELKAYIETILSQSGNEELALLYEQIKTSLIERARHEVKKSVEQGEQNIRESEQIVSDETAEQTATLVANLADVVIPAKPEEIDYV